MTGYYYFGSVIVSVERIGRVSVCKASDSKHPEIPALKTTLRQHGFKAAELAYQKFLKGKEGI